MTWSPHTEECCSERSAIFSCFLQMKTMLSPKPWSPLFHLTLFNTVYWQIFVYSIEVSFILEISFYFFSPANQSFCLHTIQGAGAKTWVPEGPIHPTHNT